MTIVDVMTYSRSRETTKQQLFGPKVEESYFLDDRWQRLY